MPSATVVTWAGQMGYMRDALAIESKDKQIQNLTEMYECALAELHKERARDQKGEVIEIIKSR